MIPPFLIKFQRLFPWPELNSLKYEYQCEQPIMIPHLTYKNHSYKYSTVSAAVSARRPSFQDAFSVALETVLPLFLLRYSENHASPYNLIFLSRCRSSNEMAVILHLRFSHQCSDQPPQRTVSILPIVTSTRPEIMIGRQNSCYQR